MVSDDTIAAVATPAGRGGIGVIRIAGPQAFSLAKAITRLTQLAVGRPQRTKFRDVFGNVIDDGLLLAFRAPHSFTGDDIVELHAHGSPVVLDMLLATLTSHGARLAQPGEFSMRAYLAGKIDLAQAEAIADLIDSETWAMARAAAGSLQGELSRAVNEIKREIVQTRVYVEAAIDFPDEDIDPLAELNIGGRIDAHLMAVDALLERAANSLRLRDGLKVVLAGRPNAGKSSLLNRFSGRDSAIVTPLPGTTRDVLREQLDLAGVAIEMFDTAGLRAPNDPVEAEGIRRAHVAIEQADLLLLVVDGTATTQRDAIQLLADHDLDVPTWRDRALVLINKIDLTGEPASEMQPHVTPDAAIRLSAEHGTGIEVLRQRLRSRVQHSSVESNFLARRRHVDALQRTQQGLANAGALAAAQGALELLAEELRSAQHELGAIVGEVSADELLGNIFASFCIGK